MRQRAWFRLYCCMLDNGKVRNLAEKDQLMFVWCLCLHEEGRLVGKDVGQVAYAVRLSERDVKGRLERLVAANLLLTDYTPKGWDEYQAEDYSTPRNRRWREKQKSNGDATACNGDATACNGDATACNKEQKAESCSNIEERRGEEKRREESGKATPGEMVRVLGELRSIGGDFEKLTEMQVLGIYQSYPRADWDETVRALRLDYGAGGRIPITSNVQKELRKYASTAETRVERGGGDKKQRPPWVDGEVAETDRLREKAAAAAAERQRGTP